MTHLQSLLRLGDDQVVPEPGGDIITDALRAVRTHFGMEVAYLSEIVEDEWVVRACDAPGLEALIKPGDRRPLETVYCKKVADGELPELIPDTANVPLAQKIPTTHEVPIRAHVSIAIKHSDGSYYGNFCCLSPTPNPTLNDRDLEVMRQFAGLAQRQVQMMSALDTGRDESRARIEKMLASRNYHLVYQPICRVSDRAIAGYEALCRFDEKPLRSPDQWFTEAAGVDLGIDLESRVLRSTLEELHRVPQGRFVSVNASPQLVVGGDLVSLFEQFDASRIVLELTEHAPIEDQQALIAVLNKLRALGIKIAMDDAGNGYAGLKQLLELRPDRIKLDRSLVTNVDTDPASRAMVAAMVAYARDTGSTLVAEGVETAEGLSTLDGLGVVYAQGWHLGLPARLSDILERLA